MLLNNGGHNGGEVLNTKGKHLKIEDTFMNLIGHRQREVKNLNILLHGTENTGVTINW